MTRKRITCIVSLILAVLMLFTVSGCTSGRTMDTDSTADGSSEQNWFGEGSTTVIGDNTNNSNNNSGSNGGGNTGQLTQQTPNVIKSEDFPWPDLKFDSDTVTVLAIGVDNNSYSFEQKILKEQYGLNVEFVSADFNGLESKFQQMWSAGNAPDAIFCKFSSHRTYSLVLKGMYRDINSMTDVNDKDLWGDLTNAYKQTLQLGKNYFVITDMTKGPYVIYNKKLFRDAGVDDLWKTYKANPDGWDWDKLEEIGPKLADKATGITGLVMDDGESFFHTSGQRYGEWGETRETTKSNMKNQCFARAAELITKGRTDGWITTNAVTTYADVFGNEAAAMCFDYTDGIRSQWTDIAKRGDLGIVPIPKDPEASKRWNYKYLNSWALPTKSKNPNGGLAFAIACRYHSITDEGLAEVESGYRQLGATDLNIQQMFEPDKVGGVFIDMGKNLGYTNVWNCILHEHPWSSTFSGETLNTTNRYIDEVFAGVE